MNIYGINTVEQTLDVLHNDAKKDFMRIGRGLVKSAFRPMRPIDFKHAYLTISKEQGETIRQLIVDNNCKTILEFGTSFGISTIYLADAARKNDGIVVTTGIVRK